jgi:hypothetical protein
VGLLFVGGTTTATAQETPKPSPEHALLKSMEGTWDAKCKFGPQESKGTMVYKLMPGDLWLTSDFKCDMMGQPFHGHGVMGYDTNKKKYVSCWADSMSTGLTTGEGTYDAAKKVFTENNEGPGPDGKMMKMKMVTELKGPDEMLFTMYMPDPSGKDQPVMTIHYTRKK